MKYSIRRHNAGTDSNPDYQWYVYGEMNLVEICGKPLWFRDEDVARDFSISLSLATDSILRKIIPDGKILHNVYGEPIICKKVEMECNSIGKNYEVQG